VAALLHTHVHYWRGGAPEWGLLEGGRQVAAWTFPKRACKAQAAAGVHPSMAVTDCNRLA
jgi:hypothetical protein